MFWKENLCVGVLLVLNNMDYDCELSPGIRSAFSWRLLVVCKKLCFNPSIMLSSLYVSFSCRDQ
ncbi:hypothetical protein HanRHA438_Chr17g0830151 [Helianthus annuus]|nr:hypothetical protein HanRHA438_Chr17g0830151 [Helianthus annuus]